MVIQLDGASLLKRVLCLLLIAIVLIMSIGLPYAQAVAAEIAVAAGAKELICAVLIACGFEFARNEDARSVAGKVWDWLGEHRTNVLGFFRQTAEYYTGVHTSKVTGIRLSTDVFGAISDAISSLFTKADTGYFFDGEVLTLSNSAGADAISWPTVGLQRIYLRNSIAGDRYTIGTTTIRDDGYFITEYLYESIWTSDGAYVRDPVTYTATTSAYTNGGWDHLLTLPKFFYVSGRYVEICVMDGTRRRSLGIVSSGVSYPCDVVLSDSISFGGTMTYPGDQTMVLAPPMPGVTTGEDGKEVVVYPPMSLNPDDHKKEIPLPPSGLVDDIPYDVPIDATTGEVIDTQNPDISGEDANIFQRFWDWIKGLLQSILDAIKAIASAIVGFFDSPSDFCLNFDGFKNLILPERFPFCIPFDLVNSVRVFSANAQDFSFRIDFDTKFFSVHHAVDLTPFVLPIAFFRYTCVIWFCWVLITRTRDMIKW